MKITKGVLSVISPNCVTLAFKNKTGVIIQLTIKQGDKLDIFVVMGENTRSYYWYDNDGVLHNHRFDGSMTAKLFDMVSKSEIYYAEQTSSRGA